MFDGASRSAIAGIARRLGVEPAALLAVAEIESAGKPFASVNGKPMPLIRWECHYFHRLLPPNLRQKGIQARLAHPVAGTIPNPASQTARYAMLARGRAIHEEAAISSCSWGLGQVMGSHWRNLGFTSPEQFAKVACSGIAGQTELMARFIRKNGLTDALKRKNWAAFARAYNGPAYRTNRYDEKMARAYIRYLGKAPPPGVMAPVIVDYAKAMADFVPTQAASEFVLDTGSSGPGVKELQLALRRAGSFLYVDGHYGPATRKAVAEFQRKSGLPPSGNVDEATRAKLIQRQGTGAAEAWWSKRPSGSAAPAGPSGLVAAQQPQKKKAWWDA